MLGPKRLELLHELIPAASAMALLVNPTDQINTEIIMREVQEAARTFGLELHVLRASTDDDLEIAFAKVIPLRAGGLVVATDAFFSSRLEQLAGLAIRHAVPAIYQFREFVAAGGLMSYGGNIMDAFHGAGVYTGRILRGDKPEVLPVQQVTKVELYINLKTAKKFGLNVPNLLSGRADEVIE
jgi:putative ABC transport system substrate-binding protein